MDVGSIKQAWPIYSEWPNVTYSASPPPEGIWVFEGDELLLGCCIFPFEHFMLVTGIVTNPKLSEEGEARALRFFLRVLEGHQKVTYRSLFIDMVWTADGNDLLIRRIPTMQGIHIVPETENPSSKSAEDSQGEGKTGPTAKSGLEESDAPPSEPPAEKPAPKKAKKSKRAAKKRKAGEKI